MNSARQRRWIVAAILIGIFYAVIGVGFARLANPATARMLFAWRLAAWVVSAMAYALHICYEQFRLKSSIVITAFHVALAAALGAFGLAVAANIHGYQVGSSHRRAVNLALIVWPMVTAVPAFVVALIVAGGLKFFRNRL